MMDPLAGFYILLGLIFDIVGAYLIVSNIISYKSRWNLALEKMSGIFQKKFQEMLPKTETMNDKLLDKQAWEEFGNKTAKVLEMTKTFRDKFDREMEKEKNKTTENRAFSGLACLIGGFLLQGLGVIIQLS